MIKWQKHPEYIEFMRNTIPGKTIHEIRQAFLDEYGIELSIGVIKGFKSKYKVKSGTNGGQFKKGQVAPNKGRKLTPEEYKKSEPTMFKKGHIPKNHLPVGTEQFRPGNGYVFVKVAEPNKWRLKQRVVWERYYGEKLTTNDVIIFVDNDPLNFDIDNLCKLTRSEFCRLNQDHLRCEDSEVNKVAINIAKIRARMNRKEATYD